MFGMASLFTFKWNRNTKCIIIIGNRLPDGTKAVQIIYSRKRKKAYLFINIFGFNTVIFISFEKIT